MGIFANILNKIFPSDHPAHANTDVAANTAGAPDSAATAAPSATAPAVAPASAQQVDVDAVLTGLAAKNPEKLNWRTSIVDLLKLLHLDSSLTARKELAAELHYTGSTDDSAAMNIWLHKEVVRKLAANGGKVPADLLD